MALGAKFSPENQLRMLQEGTLYFEKINYQNEGNGTPTPLAADLIF